jgi:uncharacterized membrane protein YdjX (TVP38/TMEM64 family)
MKQEMPPKEMPGCPEGLPGAVVAPIGAAGSSGTGRPRSVLKILQRAWPLLAVAAVMILVFATGWHRHVTIENIVQLHDRFHVVLSEHPVASVLAFVAIYIAAASLSLPGCPIMTATGGLLFGWFVGGLATVVGATIGATILFLIARSAIGGLLGERTAPWLTKLRQGFKDDALSYLLFLRLVPAFPFWFVNVAPAVLGVPLRTYVIGTFFGIIPATFAFASAGAGLDSIIMAAKAEFAQCVAEKGAEACRLSIHASSLVTRELVLALLLLGVVALIPVALRRWRHNHAAAK